MSDLERLNDFCFSLLYDFMSEEVDLYRNKLGFHFAFDFKYMMFVRSSNENQVKLYGPGIRVRHNLFDTYLDSICVDDFLDIKKGIYESCKEEIKRSIREFNRPDYSLLFNEDSHNEFNLDMSKYYQIFVIEHQDRIIDIFENEFNKL